MARHRPRRYRSNPTARELGALVITTALTAGVATLVTWWVTKKFLTSDQPQQKQPPQLPPGPAPAPYNESPQEGYWA